MSASNGGMPCMLELCYTSCKPAGASTMTKRNELNRATLAAILGLLLVFAFALGTSRSRARQSGIANGLGPNEAVTYFIAQGNPYTGYRPADRELALWAFKAWQRGAEKRLRFEPASESAALIRLQWA